MSQTFATIKQDLDTLIEWGVANLNTAIAIDSQSDESSTSIPSTEGQRKLSATLKTLLTEMGYEAEADSSANLLVRIPSNLPASATVPPIAMMVHLDTSEGTFPIPQLLETPAWDGSRLAFPDNDRLHVSSEVYPETAFFVGQDLLHGTGATPVGLDNKLGMAEILTLAQALHANPQIPHGEIYLVFRPDEEIGRMEAVEGLAETFVARGIRYGYTIDGLDPFEINVENFNAARARISIKGQALALPPAALTKQLILDVYGVKSHGATAKAEGYRNTTILFAEAMQLLGKRTDIIPVEMASDSVAEINASLTFWLRGDDEATILASQEALVAAFEQVLKPHQLRGAILKSHAPTPITSNESCSDELQRLASHLQAFLQTPGVTPLLSEHSDGYQGYTNPYFVKRLGEGEIQLDYRIRAFTPEEREAREAHLQQVCNADEHISIAIEQQYVNMGPALASFPELVTWAKRAAEAIDVKPLERPIRGGTGVDPFLTKGIPIANLGTGYFAPESEKEFTSRQTLGRHVLWLLALIQVIAQPEAPA